LYYSLISQLVLSREVNWKGKWGTSGNSSVINYIAVPLFSAMAIFFVILSFVVSSHWWHITLIFPSWPHFHLLHPYPTPRVKIQKFKELKLYASSVILVSNFFVLSRGGAYVSTTSLECTWHCLTKDTVNIAVMPEVWGKKCSDWRSAQSADRGWGVAPAEDISTRQTSWCNKPFVEWWSAKCWHCFCLSVIVGSTVAGILMWHRVGPDYMYNYCVTHRVIASS